MIFLNSEPVVEEVVSEITLEDVYELLEYISEDISGLKSQFLYLQDEVINLQELVSQKFDVLQQTVEIMPEYNQVQYIIAFLLMLVCFELMKLVRGWTNSFKLKGVK